jgi:hypothetical protein
MDRPPRAFWQIWNMSFGFLGIQFGWGLQMANMLAAPHWIDRAADHRPPPRPRAPGPLIQSPMMLRSPH